MTDPGQIQDFLRELREQTAAVAARIEGAELSSVDPTLISSYVDGVRLLHKQLNDAYRTEEGRSRIIEKFFDQWNNMVHGVLYVGEHYLTSGELTERQFGILQAAVEEIERYTSRFAA